MTIRACCKVSVAFCQHTASASRRLRRQNRCWTTSPTAKRTAFHLGGISGIELQRQLIASGRKLPVIFMTAIDNDTTHQRAIDVGYVAYLRKPFLAKVLIDAINGWVT
jgi:CheY-like chemotaxis protein